MMEKHPIHGERKFSQSLHGHVRETGVSSGERLMGQFGYQPHLKMIYFKILFISHGFRQPRNKNNSKLLG